MLVLAMLLTQQDSQDSILHYVANAVESLGSCTTEGISLDGRWQEVRIPGRKAASLPAVVDAAEGGPVMLADVPWSWAYSLSSRHGPTGYLVVGAPAPPAESERFLLQVLAQQAGVALANARLHSRQREQAGELRRAAGCRAVPFCPCCSRVDLARSPELCWFCVARKTPGHPRSRGTGPELAMPAWAYGTDGVGPALLSPTVRGLVAADGRLRIRHPRRPWRLLSAHGHGGTRPRHGR
jgi:hypothetical protein